MYRLIWESIHSSLYAIHYACFRPMFLFCDMFLWRPLFTNFSTLKWVDSELVYYISSSGLLQIAHYWANTAGSVVVRMGYSLIGSFCNN